MGESYDEQELHLGEEMRVMARKKSAPVKEGFQGGVRGQAKSTSLGESIVH